MNVLKNQKGIGLIETLLALGVGIIVITSMVSLAVFTIRASLQNKLALEGTQLVSQEIELVRSYRDGQATWQDFIDSMVSLNCFSSPCSMDSTVAIPQSGATVYNEDTAEEISKQFTLTNLSGGDNSDAELVRVNAKATWTIGTDVREAYNYTELSNWRER